MLLYKYRSTSPLEHLLDIVVEERLYCAEYSSLNDPFEGQFRAIVPSTDFYNLRMRRGKTTLVDLAQLPAPQTRIRVCSLSKDPSDVRLWSLYADGHRGVVLEFDFTGMEDQVTEVKYKTPLPSFGTTLLAGATAEDVLSHKTDHWSYEQEVRLITEESQFQVSGRLKRIIFGIRTSNSVKQLIRKIRPTDIEYTDASLNHAGVSVRTNPSIERTPDGSAHVIR